MPNRHQPRQPRRASHYGLRQSESDAATSTHLAGHIMWLPSKGQVSVDTDLDDRCYNHPVVILSPNISLDGKVTILTMTSLGDQDLLTKHPSNPALRRTYLPISPANQHPDLRILLGLQQGETLRKKFYVKTETQHTIPLAALRAYDSRESTRSTYVLLKSSYRVLIEHAGYRAPVPSHMVTTHGVSLGVDFRALIPIPGIPAGTAAASIMRSAVAPRSTDTQPARTGTQHQLGAHVQSQAGVQGSRLNIQQRMYQDHYSYDYHSSRVGTATAGAEGKATAPPFYYSGSGTEDILPRWHTHTHRRVQTTSASRNPLLPNGQDWYIDRDDWRRRAQSSSDSTTTTTSGEVLCGLLLMLVMAACFWGVLWLGWAYLPVLFGKLLEGASWIWGYVIEAGKDVWQFLLGLWKWVVEHVKEVRG